RRVSEARAAAVATAAPQGIRSFSIITVPAIQRTCGDCLEAAILGYDAAAKRMRSYAFTSQDSFAPFETTADPSNRIFALGAYGPGDTPTLNRLTERMKIAHMKHAPWIASALRDSMNELHTSHQVEIGEASYFAALDARGIVALGED